MNAADVFWIEYKELCKRHGMALFYDAGYDFATEIYKLSEKRVSRLDDLTCDDWTDYDEEQKPC